MAIVFRCPTCRNLCAFEAKYAGRGARCTKCRQRFIIPSENNAPAEKVREEPGVPISGFYRSVFIDSRKVLSGRENIVIAVFIIAVVTFKFFLGHFNFSFLVPGFAVNIPIDWITIIICWGCLFWFYMAVVESAALGADELPDIEMGEGLAWIATIIKSIYLFIVALILAELPFMAAGAILRENFGIDCPWLRHALVLAGFFFFPMVLLTISSADQLWLVFRPDYIVVPICRAFRPYLVCTGLVGVAVLMQLMTVEYGALEDARWWLVAGHLLFDILAVIVAVLAMRSVGLFYRHYSCYFGWKRSAL
ncbi:MAG: hypothetical protein DRP66_05650 [Planctomycetota bacterium]|nr:MAG: hypothetical protein DRP66_05650 [Planctomycetota bacterium]